MKRLMTACLTVFVLTMLSLALGAGAASAHSRIPTQPLNNCTPYHYHVVFHKELWDESYTTDYGYLELLADGCGWVQAHTHAYNSQSYVEVSLGEEIQTSYGVGYQTVQDVITSGYDAWTNVFPTYGGDRYATGAVTDESDEETSMTNGYYYP